MKGQANQKPASVKILRWFYLAVFSISFGTIALLHTIPKPFADVVRVPTFLGEGEKYIGQPYEVTHPVYLGVLIFYLCLTLLAGISLLDVENKFLGKLLAVSSFLGFLLMGVVALFFLFALKWAGLDAGLVSWQAILYFGVTVSLFLLNLLTFLMRGKQADV